MDDLREKYKPNSQKSKLIDDQQMTPRRKEVRQISTHSARIRKKSPGKKFVESFIADDVANIKDYILYDVILPAFKNTIVDAVTNSIQMIFWGESRHSSNTVRNGGRSYVSYGNFSSSNRRPIDSISRARHDFDDIVLDSRGEAEEVLSNLVDLVDDYGRASVSDLYCMVGIQSNYTDQKWGWRDLSSASVARISDGYILKLPRTVPID